MDKTKKTTRLNTVYKTYHIKQNNTNTNPTKNRGVSGTPHAASIMLLMIVQTQR